MPFNITESVYTIEKKENFLLITYDSNRIIVFNLSNDIITYDIFNNNSNLFTLRSLEKSSVTLDYTNCTNISAGSRDDFLLVLERLIVKNNQVDEFKGNGLIDAFGRLRVSQSFTTFETKQNFDNVPLSWDELLESGSGISSSHSTNEAATIITSTLNTAGTFTRQTFRRFIYQSGKSFLTLSSGVLAVETPTATGGVRRLGYFDDNNGLFFEQNENGLSVCIRSSVSGSPSDTFIYQTNWNADKLDGTGKSGITLDITKTQIFGINFEWLGVGSIFFGFFIDGKFIICHQQNNANILDTVYMSNPNLPLRIQMVTTSSTPSISMKDICHNVIIENGINNTTISRSITGTGIISLTSGNTYALIGLRFKSNRINSQVIVTTFSALITSTTDTGILKIIINPTISGTTSYISLDNSLIEYFQGSSGNTLTGGTIVNESFINSGNTNSGNRGSSTITNVINNLRLGTSIDGTRQVLVLAFEPYSDTSLRGSIQFQETS